MRPTSATFQQLQVATFKALILLFCITLAGCIGATPLHRRTRSAQGVEQNFTLESTHVGQTSRAEIESTLKPFDVGLQSSHFLIARWSVSTWGAWAFGCGNYNCGGTGGRIWNKRNLIVEFDNDNRVKILEEFPDSELVARLSRVAQADEALDLSNPVQLNVTYLNHGPATITLTVDSFQFAEEGKNKKPYNFTIPRNKITSIGTSHIGITDETNVTEVIHFADAPKVAHRRSSKRLTIQITIPDLVKLLKFMPPSTQDSPARPH